MESCHFEDKKCLTCLYYSGNRNINKNRIETKDYHCYCTKSTDQKGNYFQKTALMNACPSFKRWGVIAEILKARNEAKKQENLLWIEKHRNEHQSNSTNKASSKDSYTPKTLSDEQLKKIIKILFITFGILLFFTLIYKCVSHR